MARATSLRLVYGLLALTVATFFIAPLALDQVSAAFRGSAIRAKDTVAQRYQLRQRTNNFYNRSKASYASRRA